MKAQLPLFICDRLIRIALMFFFSVSHSTQQQRGTKIGVDDNVETEYETKGEQSAMKCECDRATNTEYCIYAMKTLVYELSNCLASG